MLLPKKSQGLRQAFLNQTLCPTGPGGARNVQTVRPGLARATAGGIRVRWIQSRLVLKLVMVS